MTERSLFEHLPEFPQSLPADELQMLAWLPVWPTTTEVFPEVRTIAGRLERRGLVKIERHKMDPIEIWPTWFAGKLPTAGLRAIPGERAQDREG